MKIEKNIPIPSRNPYMHYPFKDMAVGDSFFVPATRFNTARQCAYRYGRLHNVKFSSRKENDGMRIWLVA